MKQFFQMLSWVRGLMLFASGGAILSAVMMFVVGFDHLLHAFWRFFDPAQTGDAFYKGVTIDVLESVDSFLFALVFIIFAYAIAIGFVFRLPLRQENDLPRWMKVEGISELKQTLVEVVLVGLIIIFARVAVEQGRDLDWDDLVLPIGILLLAGAMRLLRVGETGAAIPQSATKPGDPESSP